MEACVIDTGRFKLDGGAMFGVVPRSMWQRLNPPDANNLCNWALRCLLLDIGERKILFDTGVGEKQSDKFKAHFEPVTNSIVLQLAKRALRPEDITDVFITHMHFDHVGGALEYNERGKIVPAFPNATYWTCKSHLDWALNPNDRERASFLVENIQPLIDHDVLAYIDEDNSRWLDIANVLFAYGHTEAMMIPHIEIDGRILVFCADLLPSSFHLRMPYVMSYDIRPLQTLKEKRKFLEDAVDRGYILFLEHDPQTECITIKKDDRGRFVVNQFLTLDEALGCT